MQAAIRAETRPVNGGHILYDAAQGDHMHEHVFTPSYWRTREALSEPLGGRGAAFRIQDGELDWVLRFYLRGGLPGRFVHDSYLYTGLERTRAWREWRMLAEMHARGLPVPRPVAARVLRNGLRYHAAIITETLPGRSLAALLDDNAMTKKAWREIGRIIRRLHDFGAWHADLNAHNILVDEPASHAPRVSVIDFDRGRIRPQDTAWRRANLSRLHRSLVKVAPREDQQVVVRDGWLQLEQAYEEGTPAT